MYIFKLKSGATLQVIDGTHAKATYIITEDVFVIVNPINKMVILQGDVNDIKEHLISDCMTTENNKIRNLLILFLNIVR